MEPINYQQNTKKYNFLVLGEAGNGKTSLAYTLTKNLEKFKPKSGTKPGSKEIIHGSSIDKANKIQYTIIDTIGFAHEDFKSSNIEQKLLDYLKDSSYIVKIDAVLYVINIRLRNSNISTFNFLKDLKFFDFKKNLIIVITGIDEVYGDHDFQNSLGETYKITDEIFGEKKREKVVLWINEKLMNNNHSKTIREKDGLKDIFHDEEKELLKAVLCCQPLQFNALNEYVQELKFKTKELIINIINKKKFVEKKKTINISFDFSFLMMPDGKIDISQAAVVANSGIAVAGGALMTGVSSAIVNAISVNILFNGIKVGSGYSLGSYIPAANALSMARAASGFIAYQKSAGSIIVGCTTGA